LTNAPNSAAAVVQGFQRTNQSYYTIRIAMPPEEVARLSYLMKPLSDQVNRAFRQ
jgi:hypothetical protein